MVSGRVAVLSGRGARMQMSFALTYEYEDVLAELLGGRVIGPPMPTTAIPRRLWRASRGARLFVPPLRFGELGERADVVLAVGQNPQDLVPSFVATELVDNADVSAVYIEELWIADLPLQPDVAAFINRFDHVFLGVLDTVAPLDAQITPSVSYTPPAVDVAGFTAGSPPQRDIATYAMGRRNAAFHDVMLARADRTGQLYLYDTFTGNPPIKDHVEHRRNLKGLIRRSHTFVVNVAKVDETNRTNAQGEVGFRYFEGVAGGAVLIGQRPGIRAFDEHFPWADAVVDLADDGSDVDDVLDALAADPERVERIRRANVAGAMRRHDVAHRVRTMLDQLGLDEPASVGERIDGLAQAAASIE